MEPQRDVTVSLDPFDEANLSSTEGLQIFKDMQKDMDDGKFDHIGKPVRVHPNATICGKYHLGKKLGEGGFGAVFNDLGDPNLVIKTEFKMRPEQTFREEVELQKKAAEKGYACPIIEAQVETLDRFIYGREPQNPATFYLMVMPQMDLSLDDVLDTYMMFDLESA